MDNRDPGVDGWFDSIPTTTRSESSVRKFVASSSTPTRARGTIKWKAPTFMYQGNQASVAAALPDARVTVLPGQMHMAHLTDPEGFAATLLSFLVEQE